ncbi:MAG: hypothetical protein HY659_13110 [Rhizobiales bacterium]|nr:hypothetical protein [Hyphomicrobiales bacterium]
MSRVSSCLAISILGAGLFAAPATAQSRYDGFWSVLIITERGTCDRAYRYPIRIFHGRVDHADPANTSFNIRGRVTGNGGVRVSVSRGDKRADGSGRLSGNGGGGRWKAVSGGECSGQWTAEKRGSL